VRMDEVLGAMGAMVVRALVGVMNQAQVLVMVELEVECIPVGEAMVAVVVTILTQDSLITKLCSRICMQV